MNTDVEGRILLTLAEQVSITSEELADKMKVDHQDIVGAAKSLEAEEYIVAEVVTKPTWKLTKEAHEIIEKGSPEFILFNLLAHGAMPQTAVQEKLGKATTGVAVSNGIVAPCDLWR